MTLAAMFVTVFNCFSCTDCVAENAKGRPMATMETNRLTRLFEKTKTVCIGRFILDVPYESHVIYGPARLPYLIERVNGKGDNFDQVIQERRRAILTEDSKLAWGDLVKKDSLLGKVIDGRARSQKIIFGVSRASGSNYMLESYQRVGSDIYVQEITLYSKRFEKEVAELNLIAPLLVPRADDQLPQGPGVCFDGAFLQEPAEPIYEYVTLGVRLNEFKDVHFSIEMTKKDQLVESDALEPRIRRAEVEARKSGAGNWYDRVKVFRRGVRNVGSWAGYEYLAWKPAIGEENDSHVFAFVSQGTPSNPMLPVLDVGLDTGVKDNATSGAKPSITNEEALYLWDKLTNSIRPRPIQGSNSK
jgi:hypothetical protein